MCAATLSKKLLTKLAISLNYSILTPGQPVLTLTLQHQVTGMETTRVPNFKGDLTRESRAWSLDLLFSRQTPRHKVLYTDERVWRLYLLTCMFTRNWDFLTRESRAWSLDLLFSRQTPSSPQGHQGIIHRWKSMKTLSTHTDVHEVQLSLTSWIFAGETWLVELLWSSYLLVPRSLTAWPK